MLRIPVSRVRGAISARPRRFLAPLLLLPLLLLPLAVAVGAPPNKPGSGKAAVKPKPPAAPPVCPPGDSAVTLLPTESDIKCDEGFLNCSGELLIAARNCTSEFQAFVRIEIYEGARRTQVLEFSPATIAPPGGVWRESIPWSTPGEVSAEVFYHPPGQASGLPGEPSVRGPYKITNKALAAAHAACEQCQGTWGHFGVNKLEGCNCKTPDGGKLCHDGEECQGYCVFQRYDGEAHEEGICSETKFLAGCYPIIFKGASQFPPSRPPPRKRTTCVD